LNEEELGEGNPHNTLVGFYLEPLRHAWRTARGHVVPAHTDPRSPRRP
jgi:hypothetical protein